jgi:type IV pilus assembly protein PilV
MTTMEDTPLNIRTNRGLSLIEVLVALLVLSVGLLGLTALQTFTLQANQGAYHRTQAVNTAYEIADFMRTNRGNPAAVDLDFPTLQTRIAQQLPGGDIDVQWNDPLLTVTVTWQDGRSVDAPVGGETLTVVTTL